MSFKHFSREPTQVGGRAEKAHRPDFDLQGHEVGVVRVPLDFDVADRARLEREGEREVGEEALVELHAFYEDSLR